MERLNKTLSKLMVLIILLSLAACTQQKRAFDKELFDLLGVDSVSIQHLLAARASDIAMDKISFEKNDPNVLAMTNGGYAIVGKKTTEKSIDGVMARTGCTIGKANLLIIHRAKWKSLWFVFFNKKTGMGVYLEVNRSVLDQNIDEFQNLPDETLFTTIETADFKGENLPEFNGNKGVIAIARLWATGVPYDFLQAIQFHNHFCPGITSGYLIIKYLDKYLPIQEPGETYSIIACPPWCKDDAFQVIFDTTTGKKGLSAVHMTRGQIQQLPGGIAGIFIRWNSKAKKGHGLVLTFNWSKKLKIPAGTPKSERAMIMMKYVDNPEVFISTLKEFEVSSEEELNKLKIAGVNPYEELGLLRKK